MVYLGTVVCFNRPCFRHQPFHMLQRALLLIASCTVGKAEHCRDLHASDRLQQRQYLTSQVCRATLSLVYWHEHARGWCGFQAGHIHMCYPLAPCTHSHTQPYTQKKRIPYQRIQVMRTGLMRPQGQLHVIACILPHLNMSPPHKRPRQQQPDNTT